MSEAQCIARQVCKVFVQMRLSPIVVRGLRAPPLLKYDRCRGTETPHYNERQILYNVAFSQHILLH